MGFTLEKASRHSCYSLITHNTGCDSVFCVFTETVLQDLREFRSREYREIGTRRKKRNKSIGYRN